MIDMEKVTDNVFTTTRVRGCNPSFVVTSDGVVVIDTPQLPTKAVEMRDLALESGPIRYLVNTEHHVDHIFGNYYFKGHGTVVTHKGIDDNFMTAAPILDPFDYAAEAVPTDDPAGAEIFPDRDEYYDDPNRGDLVFTGDITLTVGDHTFLLVHTPGHTPGQTTVVVPEERVAFTGDTIFNECQTWLMTSDVDRWVEALGTIGELDFDILVPGHGPVTGKSALADQRAILLEWKAAVARAVADGWTRDETIDRLDFEDRFPVDIGQEYMMEYILHLNAASLYDKLTGRAAEEGYFLPLPEGLKKLKA